jgi:hypothetical protein
MVGFFSYLPNVTEMISKEPNLPYREELLQMDPQLLSLLTLLLIVATIALKAYVIGVVWNCYKYLMLRNTVIRGVITYRSVPVLLRSLISTKKNGRTRAFRTRFC